MASPAHKRHASDVDAANGAFGTQPESVGSSTSQTGGGGGGGVGASSPYNMHVGGPSASTPHSFSIDTFDFGADFSLPSSLDELSIFNNGNNAAHVATMNDGQNSFSSASSNVHSASKHSQSVGQASPGSTANFSSLINASGTPSSRFKGSGASVGGGGAHSSNNSVAGSPRSIPFSPRTTMREQVLQASKSRHQSPHALGMNSNETASTSVVTDAGGQGSGDGNGVTVNASDLQSILQAINVSAASQQQHQQQIQGGNLSIGELEKLLAEKEQMERMQSMQTAFLRQQIETLQRQNPGSQLPSLGHLGQEGLPASMSAAQLMQQFQQLNSQQMLNGSAPGSSFPMQFPLQHAGQHVSHSVGPSQSKSGIPTSMNQFGLITPVSGDAFPQKHHPPFVSPLTMPGSSQAQMMDASRAALAMNGSLTPLESPAITPASVFSNIGSSSNSTDLFSPLTSPALHPQQHGHDSMTMQMSPFLGPIKGRPKARGLSGASPNGQTTTKSIPRKNRSTTAEARANRARASPLVKPTIPPAGMTRKRNGSIGGGAGLASPLGPNMPSNVINSSVAGSKPGSRRASQSDGEGKQTPTAFPPLSAGSGIAKPMDASPSETAASTPSPIEMPPPNGKPITPGSLMGIRGAGSDENGEKPKALQGKGVPGNNGRTTGKSGKALNDKQVSFAEQTSGGVNSLQNIRPGSSASHEGEGWISSMKTAGLMSGGVAGGGLESRRTSHKAAEQKRRDSLKFCFDELRNMLPAITLDDDVPGGSMLGPDGLLEDQDDEGFIIEEVGDTESARIANRAISKVALLRHSNEYLVRLKNRIGRRERDLANCRRELMDLRSRLGIPVPPEWTAMTASVAASASVLGYNTGMVNFDALAEQMHPHQAAILAAAMQQQQQLRQQQQLELGSMTGYAQPVQGSSNPSSMDTSS